MLLVERGGRLVEEDPVGLVQQHARDREALLLVRESCWSHGSVSSRRAARCSSPSSRSASRIRSSGKLPSARGIRHHRAQRPERQVGPAAERRACARAPAARCARRRTARCRRWRAAGSSCPAPDGPDDGDALARGRPSAFAALEQHAPVRRLELAGRRAAATARRRARRWIVRALEIVRAWRPSPRRRSTRRSMLARQRAISW